MPFSPGTPNQLATLDSDTKAPPTSRIGTASNASSFVLRMIDADQLRAQNRTRVKGQYDGNAPYSRSVLQEKGMGSNTNLNFRKSTAIIDQFKTPFYDLVSEVPMLALIQTAYGRSEERSDWSEIISQGFHRTVTAWEDWDSTVQFHQFQMLLNGIGPVWFADKLDWRPETGRTGEVLWQDNARTRARDWQAVAILKDYSPTELYGHVRNEAQARQLGWNLDATWNAIIQAMPDQPTVQNALEFWQQQIKNADLYYGSYDCTVVKVANLLVTEFGKGMQPGKVSHHIIRYDQPANEFLFSKLNRYDSINDMLVPFFYDIGDGTIHSINGMGKNIFAYCDIFNKLRGREVDGAMLASSPLLRFKDASQTTKGQLMQIAAMSILPPGMEFVQSQIGDGIQATVDVRRDMEMSLDSNIGNVNEAPGTPTPRQGQKLGMLKMQQKGQLKKGEINRYYTTFSKLLNLMYRRMANPNIKAHHPGGREALAFQKWCMDRGVPAQALVEIDSVTAYKSLGAGSMANALMTVDWLMDHIQSFPEEGKQIILRLATSRIAGTDTATAALGSTTKQPHVTDDDWVATTENGSLREGAQPLITQSQSAVTHLAIHLGDAGHHYQQVQQGAQQGGMDMQALHGLSIHLDAAGVHCKKHLQTIEHDPIREDDFKQFEKQWREMSKLADQVRQQLQAMQQAAAQQQSQQGEPENKIPLLSKIYDKGPESSRPQIEQMIGIQRQPGEPSVVTQNLQLKAGALQLKAAKQQQVMAHDDVKLAAELQTNGAEK